MNLNLLNDLCKGFDDIECDLEKVTISFKGSSPSNLSLSQKNAEQIMHRLFLGHLYKYNNVKYEFPVSKYGEGDKKTDVAIVEDDKILGLCENKVSTSSLIGSKLTEARTQLSRDIFLHYSNNDYKMTKVLFASIMITNPDKLLKRPELMADMLNADKRSLINNTQKVWEKYNILFITYMINTKDIDESFDLNDHEFVYSIPTFTKIRFTNKTLFSNTYKLSAYASSVSKANIYNYSDGQDNNNTRPEDINRVQSLKENMLNDINKSFKYESIFQQYQQFAQQSAKTFTTNENESYLYFKEDKDGQGFVIICSTDSVITNGQHSILSIKNIITNAYKNPTENESIITFIENSCVNVEIVLTTDKNMAKQAAIISNAVTEQDKSDIHINNHLGAYQLLSTYLSETNRRVSVNKSHYINPDLPIYGEVIDIKSIIELLLKRINNIKKYEDIYRNWEHYVEYDNFVAELYELGLSKEETIEAVLRKHSTTSHINKAANHFLLSNLLLVHPYNISNSAVVSKITKFVNKPSVDSAKSVLASLPSYDKEVRQIIDIIIDGLYDNSDVSVLINRLKKLEVQNGVNVEYVENNIFKAYDDIIKINKFIDDKTQNKKILFNSMLEDLAVYETDTVIDLYNNIDIRTLNNKRNSNVNEIYEMFKSFRNKLSRTTV